MNTVRMKISELSHPDTNVRMHTEKQLKEFRRSLNMFGQIRPFVCDENGVVLAGNGMLEAMQSMGTEEADCYVISGLTEKEKKKLMLADNRIFSLGVDDMSAFDAIVAELQDVDIPGYDEDLLNTLIASASDVDEMLSGYGNFSQSSQANMQKAAETEQQETTRQDAQFEQLTEQKEEYIPPIQAKASEVRTEERYVICPSCGERIRI